MEFAEFLMFISKACIVVGGTLFVICVLRRLI